MSVAQPVRFLVMEPAQLSLSPQLDTSVHILLEILEI